MKTQTYELLNVNKSMFPRYNVDYTGVGLAKYNVVRICKSVLHQYFNLPNRSKIWVNVSSYPHKGSVTVKRKRSQFGTNRVYAAGHREFIGGIADFITYLRKHHGLKGKTIHVSFDYEVAE